MKNRIRIPAGIHDKHSRLAWSFLKRILALPGVKVNRAAFLRRQLGSHFPAEQIEAAISSNPAKAGIGIRDIEGIANGSIRYHVSLAGAAAFGAGIPGGLALLATVPADTTQYYAHALILAQKLAYLNGWPDLLEDGDFDDDTEHKVLILLGVMMGVTQANSALKVITQAFSQEVAVRVPRKAFGKAVPYRLLKQTLRWIGISLNKQLFAKGVSRVIPVVGGFVAAGTTAFTLRPMARRLQKHLSQLEFAKAPQDKQITIAIDP